MGTFNGKVKRVTSSQTGQNKTETIVEISDDPSSEVNCVKVTYPSDLGPTEDPTECDYTDTQNGIRIFSNTSLELVEYSSGKEVTLYVVMEDSNSNVLGTDSVKVKI